MQERVLGFVDCRLLFRFFVLRALNQKLGMHLTISLSRRSQYAPEYFKEFLFLIVNFITIKGFCQVPALLVLSLLRSDKAFCQPFLTGGKRLYSVDCSVVNFADV